MIVNPCSALLIATGPVGSAFDASLGEAVPQDIADAFLCGPSPDRLLRVLASSNSSGGAGASQAETFYKRGLDKLLIGLLNEALFDLNCAIEIHPDYEEALAARGLAKFCLWHFDGAIEDLDRAILLNPKKARLYVLHGLVMANMNNFDGVLGDCKRALEVDPKCNWTSMCDEEVELACSIIEKSQNIS